jgi:hypothetical protein
MWRSFLRFKEFVFFVFRAKSTMAIVSELEGPLLAKINEKGVHVIDLGCGGKAERIMQLASKHPDRLYIGVDRHFTAKPPVNLILIQTENPERVLKSLRTGIVRRINADYFFRHIPPEGRDVIARESHRVLWHRGVLTRTGRMMDNPWLIDLLKKNGFDIAYIRGVEKESEVRSPQTGRYWESFKKGRKTSQPFTVCARKRIR